MSMHRPQAKTAATPLLDTDKEKKIAQIIGKGGSVSDSNEEELKKVQLRIEQSLLTRIDSVRERKPKRIRASRHSWMVEAILEKLDREE